MRPARSPCVRTRVGILRYIVQGFGWEVGSQVAREGIQTLKQRADEQAAEQAEQLSPRQAAKLARKQAKQEARERKEREAAVARKRAEIEAQLAELKRRSGR
jgi:hypothetical protein